jgi:hypothetical protein
MLNQAKRPIGRDRISGPTVDVHLMVARPGIKEIFGLSLFRIHHLKFPSSGFYKNAALGFSKTSNLPLYFQKPEKPEPE